MVQEDDDASGDSELNFEALEHAGNESQTHQDLIQERQNIMAKLGEFSMSGLEASNIGGNNLDSGIPKDNAIDDISEISSGIRENNNKDPDSLESRL